MTDLSQTIAPKSDQMNSDDLISGPRTITVTKVSLLTEADQPIAINFEGDTGKPYKPCKSMRRVMVSIWGPDGGKYSGRSMTLYRDAAVQFGGMAVGGIRISHMSHIDKPITLALTATRANRKPFTVKPLDVDHRSPGPVKAIEAEARKAAAAGVAAFTTFWNGPGKPHRETLRPNLAAFQATAKAADAQAEKQKGVTDSDDPFGVVTAEESGQALSAEAAEGLAALHACTTETELDASWEMLSVDACREIGAAILEELRAALREPAEAE